MPMRDAICGFTVERAAPERAAADAARALGQPRRRSAAREYSFPLGNAPFPRLVSDAGRLGRADNGPHARAFLSVTCAHPK